MLMDLRGVSISLSFSYSFEELEMSSMLRTRKWNKVLLPLGLPRKDQPISTFLLLGSIKFLVALCSKKERKVVSSRPRSLDATPDKLGDGISMVAKLFQQLLAVHYSVTKYILEKQRWLAFDRTRCDSIYVRHSIS